MLVRLEELKHARDNMGMNRDVLRSIEQGTRVLAQNKLDVDHAETIMDNMEEAVQNAQEVSDVFARGMMNEPNVDRELAELMREPLPQVPTELPKVPTGPVSTMEAELQELERTPVSA
jgi:50S ribosomal subunit-associated GTPase HflX